MRAFPGWGAPLILLLLLSCSRPLSSNNVSLWQTIAPDLGPAMHSVPGFCTIEDAERTCSFGVSLECTAEQGRSLAPPEEEREVGPVRALGEVNDEYIVRFKEYRHSSEFKQALKEKLEGHGRAWQWLDRNNPASAFPTDFGLLRIERMQYENLLEALRKLEFVKDVSPQMRFTRSLTTEKSEDMTGDEGAGKKHEEFELEEMLERKPPGRLRTKLSFESGSEGATMPDFPNITLNHDRKLLLQVMRCGFC